MYAIIATGGKQYKVAEGDIIKVEKLGVEAGQTYTFDQVLAVSGDEYNQSHLPGFEDQESWNSEVILSLPSDGSAVCIR